jgi:hypothetical protein|tara:strand:- start:241 stop:819 length:579 start_codon:yes stop_codon:yes gene_type:complete
MNDAKISALGEAIYPHLNKPDVKFSEAGEYKVTLKVNKSDASKMLGEYKQAIDDSLIKAEKENKGKTIQSAPIPYTEEGDYVFFKYKLKATGTNFKTKEKFSQRPALFDAKNNPIDNSILIFGGSKMKIAYSLVPYFTPMLGAGITARIKAVQVIELVEGKQMNLFDKEDGYEAKSESQNEIPTEVQESKDF